MKLLSFLGAVGLGIFSGAWIIAARRRRADARKSFNGPTININEASQQEIMQSSGPGRRHGRADRGAPALSQQD